LKYRIVIVIVITLVISFVHSNITYAQSNYQYEYDQNNKLLKISKDNVSYMKFKYDLNGNLTKKFLLLPPTHNLNAEITGNNTAKLTGMKFLGQFVIISI
jgi:hypothetical protein